MDDLGFYQYYKIGYFIRVNLAKLQNYAHLGASIDHPTNN